MYIVKKTIIEVAASVLGWKEGETEGASYCLSRLLCGRAMAVAPRGPFGRVIRVGVQNAVLTGHESCSKK